MFLNKKFIQSEYDGLNDVCFEYMHMWFVFLEMCTSFIVNHFTNFTRTKLNLLID